MFRLNCSREHLLKVLETRPSWVKGGIKNIAPETDATCLTDGIDNDMERWLRSQGISTTYVRNA